MIDLDGAIDLHVHTAPDVYPRSVDDLELVREAESAGMAGLLLKSHHTLTADRATLACKDSGIRVFGGLVLNHTVGGLNPVAVETAVAFGAREIWMPTLHAAHCLETGEQEMFLAEARKGRKGIRMFDAEGRPADGLLQVLEVIRDAKVILGTGHLEPVESLALLRLAREMGIEKILVTHPLMSFTRFEKSQMAETARLGAVLEFAYLSCSHGWLGAVEPKQTADSIKSVGPAHCVICTDGGQEYNPHPPQMLADFAEALTAEGVTQEDLRLMMCENPASLLDL